jgi:hypothetical protein
MISILFGKERCIQIQYSTEMKSEIKWYAGFFRVFEKQIAFYDLNNILKLWTEVAGPPLWSSGQSFWLQIQRSWFRFPALRDFLSSSGSGTGSTREVN